MEKTLSWYVFFFFSLFLFLFFVIFIFILFFFFILGWHSGKGDGPGCSGAEGSFHAKTLCCVFCTGGREGRIHEEGPACGAEGDGGEKPGAIQDGISGGRCVGEGLDVREGGKGIMVGRMMIATFVKITFINTPNIPTGALGTMCSFNDYDGEPMGGNLMFLTEYLREKWGFKGLFVLYHIHLIILYYLFSHFYHYFSLSSGYVVSDSGVIEWMHGDYHVANTLEDAVAMAVNAGCGMWK
jgi:hypothetical protein